MTRFFAVIYICSIFPIFLLHAQEENTNITVRITEISPQKMGAEEEWFEFTLQADAPIDISDWSVTNGTSTKTFLEKKSLLISENVTENEEGRLIFSSEQEEYLFWSKSPVSLTNSGATIQIWDNHETLLDEITYSDTKKGTTDGELYAEVWNRNPADDASEERKVFPLLYRQNDQNLRHSRGEENFEPPTFPEDIEIFISEASPDNEETDFIEIYIQSSLNPPANLKYMEIKQKSSPRTLMYFTNDFWVNAGEFIVVNFSGADANALTQNQDPYQVSTVASGLSAGSETIEVVLYSGTSWEQSKDFMCWKSGNISQAVQSEVENKREAGAWSGECTNIEDMIPNESTARREPQQDTNSENDFFRHFNGSPGDVNTPKNRPPTARFIAQGGSKISNTSRNFTGFDGTSLTSTDPDGEHDLVSWRWSINGNSCGNYEQDGWEWRQTKIGGKTCNEESARSNPDRIYFDFDRFSEFRLTLTVTDASGASGSISENIKKDFVSAGTGSTPSAFSSSAKAWIEKELHKTKKAKGSNSAPRNSSAEDDFFEDFLLVFSKQPPSEDPDFSSLDFSTFAPVSNETKPKEEPSSSVLYQRDRISESQKSRLRKNIGLIFEILSFSTQQV